MSFEVRVYDDAVVVELRGIDRLLCWRRAVRTPTSAISRVRRVNRAALEPSLSHRVYGLGGHRGDRRQGRRRVGAFMGRQTGAGRQFWAVERDQDAVLLVELDGGPWQRLVVDPARCAEDVRALVG